MSGEDGVGRQSVAKRNGGGAIMAGLSREVQVERLALAVASGRSVAGAATELGIAARTAYRMAEEETFRGRVEELRRQAVASAVGSLASAAVEAVMTLKELLSDQTPAPTRLGAARAILGELVSLHEYHELSGRVAELERRCNELANEGGGD